MQMGLKLGKSAGEFPLTATSFFSSTLSALVSSCQPLNFKPAICGCPMRNVYNSYGSAQNLRQLSAPNMADRPPSIFLFLAILALEKPLICGFYRIDRLSIDFLRLRVEQLSRDRTRHALQIQMARRHPTMFSSDIGFPLAYRTPR